MNVYGAARVIRIVALAGSLLGLFGCPNPDPNPDPNPPPVSPNSGTPLSIGSTPTCVATDPEGSAVRALKLDNITKDPCQIELSQATLLGSNMDAQFLAQVNFTPIYDGAISRLKQQVGMSPTVNIRVVTDLACFEPAGGGMTGLNIVTVDGKFLDILSEYANYRALAESRIFAESTLASLGQNAAINHIVSYHQLYPCNNAPAAYYPSSLLSTTTASRATQIFDSLAGAIMYHEYGHYWAHALSDSILDQAFFSQFTPYGYINVYPAREENDADFVAGILSHKSGHDLSLSEEMIDLMAFYMYFRQGGVTDIAQVENSYLAQFVQQNPKYSSLAARKSIIQHGYSVFQ